MEWGPFKRFLITCLFVSICEASADASDASTSLLDLNHLGSLSHHHCLRLLERMAAARVPVPTSILEPFLKEGVAGRLRGMKLKFFDDHGRHRFTAQMADALELAQPGTLLAFVYSRSVNLRGSLSFTSGEAGRPKEWQLTLERESNLERELELELTEPFFRGDPVEAIYPKGVQVQLIGAEFDEPVH